MLRCLPAILRLKGATSDIHVAKIHKDTTFLFGQFRFQNHKTQYQQEHTMEEECPGQGSYIVFVCLHKDYFCGRVASTILNLFSLAMFRILTISL